MSDESHSSTAAVADAQTTEQVEQAQQAQPRTVRKANPQRQPPYNVILLDDNDHSYEYVILMCSKLFRHEFERGWRIACEVDARGRAILLTTTKEHAELKRDQVHSYGADPLLERSAGSMTAIIEPVDDA